MCLMDRSARPLVCLSASLPSFQTAGATEEDGRAAHEAPVVLGWRRPWLLGVYCFCCASGLGLLSTGKAGDATPLGVNVAAAGSAGVLGGSGCVDTDAGDRAVLLSACPCLLLSCCWPRELMAAASWSVPPPGLSFCCKLMAAPTGAMYPSSPLVCECSAARKPTSIRGNPSRNEGCDGSGESGCLLSTPPLPSNVGLLGRRPFPSDVTCSNMHVRHLSLIYLLPLQH